MAFCSGTATVFSRMNPFLPSEAPAEAEATPSFGGCVRKLGRGGETGPHFGKVARHQDGLTSFLAMMEET